jgi:hypothetical protein
VSWINKVGVEGVAVDRDQRRRGWSGSGSRDEAGLGSWSAKAGLSREYGSRWCAIGLVKGMEEGKVGGVPSDVPYKIHR